MIFLLLNTQKKIQYYKIYISYSWFTTCIVYQRLKSSIIFICQTEEVIEKQHHNILANQNKKCMHHKIPRLYKLSNGKQFYL